MIFKVFCILIKCGKVILVNIEMVFMVVNFGFDGDEIVVFCECGELDEVWICFIKDLKF